MQILAESYRGEPSGSRRVELFKSFSRYRQRAFKPVKALLVCSIYALGSSRNISKQMVLCDGVFVSMAVTIYGANLGHCISIAQPARQCFLHGSDHRPAPCRFDMV